MSNILHRKYIPIKINQTCIWCRIVGYMSNRYLSQQFVVLNGDRRRATTRFTSATFAPHVHVIAEIHFKCSPYVWRRCMYDKSIQCASVHVLVIGLRVPRMQYCCGYWDFYGWWTIKPGLKHRFIAPQYGVGYPKTLIRLKKGLVGFTAN